MGERTDFAVYTTAVILPVLLKRDKDEPELKITNSIISIFFCSRTLQGALPSTERAELQSISRGLMSAAAKFHY